MPHSQSMSNNSFTVVVVSLYSFTVVVVWLYSALMVRWQEHYRKVTPYPNRWDWDSANFEKLEVEELI